VASLVQVLKGGMSELDKAVQDSIDMVPDDMKLCNIVDGNSFLSFAQGMLVWTPSETIQGKDIYITLCAFYFVLDRPKIRAQQTSIAPNQIKDGQPIMTPLSEWIVQFAKEVGAYMGTAASITPKSYESFMKSAPYNLAECQFVENDPTGGFKTFNELFSRKVKIGTRPIWQPNDDTQIIFPADSTFDDVFKVDEKDNEVRIKNVPWKISDLLDDNNLPSGVDFTGGVWMHAFLGPNDYHRQHAPISGNVIHASVIPGLAYLDVVVQYDESKSGSQSYLVPNRPIEKQSGDFGTVDAPDHAGYQFMQARGCIIMENDTLGYVAILPIGMAQVSSVVMEDSIANASPETPVYVSKGDPISYFQFGGSDIVMVFQAKANVTFKATPSRTGPSGQLDYYPGQHGRVGELLAVASPKA
jgi:phosphatidylserine decarboxylase